MYWTTFKKYDSRIEEFASVAVDDLIYTFSGTDMGNDNEPVDIHVLNTHTLEWSLLPDRIDINGEKLKPPDAPIKREGHTVVAYDKKIYLWGGLNGTTQTNILYCFDTKTLNWSTPKVSGMIPSSRYYHSACTSYNHMYIFGGYDSYNQQSTVDVHCLDFETMNWSYIKTTGRTPSRRNHKAIIVNNRMYIFGDFENEDESTMYLDLISNQWHRPVTTGNIAVCEHVRSLFVHNNRIYVIGGYLNIESDIFDYLYSFDTKRNHWKLIRVRGKRIEKQSCIVIRDKMFFLGSRTSTSVIHVLDFNPSLKTLAIIFIIKKGLDPSCLPKKLRSEIDLMRQHLAE